MPKNCEIPSDFRQEHGFSENFFKSIRKSADKINLSKRQVRNLVKNLGIDDARAIELRDGKKHLFGRNLKDIEEFNAAKGDVPKDTLVKVRNDDGSIDYFVSERKTDMAPSKWVVTDGTVKPNSDWTYVGKNATTDSTGALKRYTKEGNGTYKEDPQGDILLKVGKIFDGDNPPTMTELAEQGYDAVRLPNGNLRVLNKAHQEVNPQQVFIRDGKRGVGSSGTKNEPTQGEIAKELQNFGLGTRVAMTLAGGIVGNITAEDYGGTWIGGAIGLALGMPSVRNSLKGLVNEGDKTVDDITQSLAEAQKKSDEYADLTDDGYRGDPLDEEAKTTFKEEFLNDLKAAKEKGRAFWKDIFGSSYLRSGISDFANMGIKEAKKFFNILQRTETAHNVYMSDAVQVINRRFGQATSIPDFQEMQASVIRDYIESVPELRRGGFLERDDEFFLQEMGASIRRIITHGAELDNQGRLVLKGDDDLAQRVYSDQALRDQDRFVLQHSQGKELVEAHRDIFDRMGERTVDSLQDAIDEIQRVDLNSQESRLFQNFVDSGKSIKQWEKTLSDRQRELYEATKKFEPFKEAVQFREQQLKIQNLKGNYIPQVQDSEKLARLKQEFLQNNSRNGKPLLQHDAQTQDEAWSQYFTQRIVAHNNEGFTVKGLSASGEDIETVYFNNFKKALNDLRQEYVPKITDSEIRAQVVRDLESDDPVVWEKYIGQTTVNGKQVYYLKNNPDLPYNIVRDMSQEAVGQAQRMFINMSMMKQSNFLDNPRRFILPENMLQNNMTKVINQYARDVGVRSHLIRNGLGTQRGLDNQLGKIRRKLEEKGVTDIEKKMQRTREWYAAITNTKNSVEVNQSPSEIIRSRRVKKRNNKIARTVMNFAAMPFMWFTSFYAPFTPAILGSYLSSPKSIAKTYGEVLRDPQALKAMTDNLYKYGALQKKLRSISEEAQYGDYSAEGLAGGGSSLDWLYNMSQKGINFSTRFSSMKGIMSRMSFLPDVEDAGILRLTTGDLYDISGAESAMVNMAVFRELEDMTEAGLKILNGRRQGEEIMQASGGGKSFRIGEIRRKLEELGVDNPDRFIEESAKVTEDLTNTKRFYNELTGQGEQAPISGYLRNEYSRIMDTVINQYHGRTKFTRPLKWVDNPIGRVLSQFSVYAQNFGVQTLRRRMYQPLKNWTDTYEMKEETPLYKVWWHMRQGNDDELKRIFGEDNWQQAYDDFPVDAVDAFFKVTPVAMGAGAVMEMTRDTVLDSINMLASEAVGNDDYKEWERVKERFEIPASLMEDGITGHNIAKATLGTLGHAVRMGYLSRPAQIIRQAEYGKISDATPATGMINEAYNVLGEPFRHSLEDAPRQTSKALLEYIMLRSPVIGSFNGLRENATEAIFNKPTNRGTAIENIDLSY